MWGPSEFTCIGTLQSLNLTSDLSEIDVPVFFICGEYDETTSSTVSYFGSLVKNSRILILKNASHMNHIEKKEGYVDALRDYLKDMD